MPSCKCSSWNEVGGCRPGVWFVPFVPVFGWCLSAWCSIGAFLSGVQLVPGVPSGRSVPVVPVFGRSLSSRQLGRWLVSRLLVGAVLLVLVPLLGRCLLSGVRLAL